MPRSRAASTARRAVAAALRQGPVFASAISLLEIATALRRGRLALEASDAAVAITVSFSGDQIYLLRVTPSIEK